MKNTTLLLLFLAAPLGALTALQGQVIFPSSDNRVLDNTGDGMGNVSFAADDESDTLNVGDNPDNHVWRSVIKFDLEAAKVQLAAAGRINLQLTLKSRRLQVPRAWLFEVVSIPTDSRVVDIDPSGMRDDFSRKGEVIDSRPGGLLRTGEQITLDVTEQVKAALGTGVFAVRLQLDPSTNRDGVADQVAFYAGSHQVNMESLRPQLVIE